MKVEKQQLLIYILSKGKYRVVPDEGILQSFRRNGEWKEVKPAIQPTGQKQVTLSHEGTSVRVYLHILVWISQKGTYKEGKVVHHRDTDMGNCRISNLECTTHKKNIKYSLVNRAKKRENDNRMRGDVITQIRAKVADGKNHSEIARELNLKRLGVRYVVKQIEQGKTLRGETIKTEINENKFNSNDHRGTNPNDATNNSLYEEINSLDQGSSLQS